MSIAAGIALIVLGAILTFALKGGHIGDLDLHAVGVILMLAGVIGILLPVLIRNRSRFSRPTIRSRQDVMDDGTRTIVNHTDGSQTLVEHNDGEQTFAEHSDGGPSLKDGRRTHDSRQLRAGSEQEATRASAQLGRRVVLKAEAGGLVQPMLARGVEVLIGVVQDPVFGPLVALGLGGAATEILGDHAAGWPR